MKTRLVILVAAGVLGGCATSTSNKPIEQPAAPIAKMEKVEPVETKSEGPISAAFTHDGYKRDLAQRISDMNSNKVYDGRPQALLRSVVVMKYVVDSKGNLVRSEIMRSNRDNATEATALASLRNSAPFPKPMPHLLNGGRMEISETWLFNNDGRFQLRTVAQPQMDR